MRIGIGFDVHPLVPGRPLVLGGVRIPHSKGLLGHSDADVLLHAISDALLGAAGLKDIGVHFPPDDPRFQGADSLHLLQQVHHMVKGEGYRVANVDAVLIAQEPPLVPYRDEMVKNISSALDLDPSRINIKATTTEGLGFIGRGEGIGALAAVLLLDRREAQSL